MKRTAKPAPSAIVRRPALAITKRSAEDLAAGFADLVAAQLAQNTRYHYAADMRDLERFCEAYGAQAFPAAPETLAAYIAERAGVHKVSTIRRRVAGIAKAHALAGHPSPADNDLIRQALAGLARKYGEPARPKKAATADVVRAMLASLPDTDGTPAGDLRAVRDRAVLMLGYAGGFRRSELAALRVDDVSFEPAGLRVMIRQSKTDKESAGRTVGVGRWKRSAKDTGPDRCPVQAVRAWLDAAGITEGPIFRGIFNDGRARASSISGQTIALIWKRAAAAAGLNPRDFAGHSARSGHITEAYKKGIPENQIARTTGHKTLIIMRAYEQAANAFQGSAAAVGL